MSHDPKQLDEIRGAFGAFKGEPEKPAHPAGGLRDMLTGQSDDEGFGSLQERLGYERGVAESAAHIAELELALLPFANAIVKSQSAELHGATPTGNKLVFSVMGGDPIAAFNQARLLLLTKRGGE